MRFGDEWEDRWADDGGSFDEDSDEAPDGVELAYSGGEFDFSPMAEFEPDEY
jgi:hypothetical protein